MSLRTLTDAIIRSATQRKFYARILDDHVLDSSDEPRLFASQQHYFEIRLLEMFLRDQREYWRTFVPLTVAFSEFLYAGKREAVPFLVGNQLLAQIQKLVEGENVEYRNTRLAGPIPYSGGDVSLFVGLFRSQVSDLSGRLWKVLEEVIKAFDVSQMSRYLDIARPLQGGLMELVGMKEVEYRVGERQEFSEPNPSLPKQPSSFREGCFAYINCEQKELQIEQLWVKDGALHVGGGRDSLRRLNAHDYCLVQIAQVPLRNDYTTFPFHRTWQEVQMEIHRNASGSRARAAKLMLELPGQILNCHDITEEQRFQLIRAYKANFERDKALASTAPSSTTNSVPMRGGGSIATARASIDNAAATAWERGAGADAVRALREISSHWDQIPGLEQKTTSGPIELSETLLLDQLKVLRTVSPEKHCDPASLADALTIAGMPD